MVETDEMIQAPIIDEGKESVELTKNSKGYNWKIKLKEELLSDATLERLKNLNSKLELNYGG